MKISSAGSAFALNSPEAVGGAGNAGEAAAAEAVDTGWGDWSDGFAVELSGA